MKYETPTPEQLYNLIDVFQITQVELAKLAQLSVPTIKRYLRGQGEMHPYIWLEVVRKMRYYTDIGKFVYGVREGQKGVHLKYLSNHTKVCIFNVMWPVVYPVGSNQTAHNVHMNGIVIPESEAKRFGITVRNGVRA